MQSSEIPFADATFKRNTRMPVRTRVLLSFMREHGIADPTEAKALMYGQQGTDVENNTTAQEKGGDVTYDF